MNENCISEEQLNELIVAAVEEYPKESIPLKHSGLNLEKIVKNPCKFFKSKYTPYLNSADNEENSDLKALFYLLQVEKYFLQTVTISSKTLKTYFNI